MKRIEFIQTIMELYPNTFHIDNEKQFKGWVTRYKQALPENIDYDKLLKIFDREWKSTVVPPHPSFFLEFYKDVKIDKPKQIIPIIEEEPVNPQKLQQIREKLVEIVNKNKFE